MTEWLDRRRREKLALQLRTIPDDLTLAEVVACTLLPRRGQQGGSRPHPGSRPPTNLGVIDTLDVRCKDAVRDWRNPWLEQHHVEPADDPARVREPDFPDERVRLARELGEDARRGVLPTLADWVRLAHAEMLDDGQDPIDPAEQPSVTTEVGWLGMHLDWIVGQQWAEELADDVGRISRELKRIIGEGRAEYRPVCTACTTTTRRYRMIDEGAYFTCPNCGRTVRDEQMDHRQALAKSQPMDSQSFGWAGVSSELIRKWVERGLLGPALDENGETMKRGKRHLYHALDVLRVRDLMGKGA